MAARNLRAGGAGWWAGRAGVARLGAGLALLLALAGCAPSAPSAPTPSAGASAPAAGAPGQQGAGGAGAAGQQGAGGAGGAAAARAPEPPIRLVVNWSQPSGSQTAMWMPLEAGYYREQGLDVELVNIGSTSAALQAMVAGEVHLSALDPATVVQASLSGADLVLLYALVNRLVFSIVTQPSIQQPDDLRGKTLGVGRLGSSGHTAIRVALGSWGLVQDRDVSVRQMGTVPNILAGMQAGQLDGGSLSPPTNGVAKQAGFHELIDLSTQGPEYASVAVGGLRPWVAANEEAVRRFGRAYVQGIQRFKADKPLALEVYHKYLQTDDAALLDATYAQFLTLMPNPPYISEVGMANALADLALDEPRVVGRQASEWIDSRYVRELEAAGLTR